MLPTWRGYQLTREDVIHEYDPENDDKYLFALQVHDGEEYDSDEAGDSYNDEGPEEDQDF